MSVVKGVEGIPLARLNVKYGVRTLSSLAYSISQTKEKRNNVNIIFKSK